MNTCDHEKTKAYLESLKIVFAGMCLRPLRLIWRPDLEPGLHIVVRVAEHVCDDASKRILKPSTYRSQIFPVRDQYLSLASIKPGFHYTANTLTTTKKQNDYKVEQSSFTLIALF